MNRKTKRVNHVFFVIHGIGEASDIPMRPIEDCGIFIKNKFNFFNLIFFF